ncbi:MAG: histidine ammonia-lyase [Bacteroidia bacterium]
MKDSYEIKDSINFDDLKSILVEERVLSLSEDAINRIELCRNYLDRKLSANREPIYGINTVFGSLQNHTIDKKDREKLQRNLVLSHACGAGDPIPLEIVKLMLLLKVQGLSYGNSGVQKDTVQRLLDMYNYEILPIIYEYGSLGASGDLAPLAHLSLPLIGEGKVFYEGEIIASEEAFKKAGLEPVILRSKEGLALLNGTQFMSAYGTWCLLEMQKYLLWADIISAFSVDAYDCRIDPFNEMVHHVRPHKGQIKTAENIRSLLQGSQILKRKKNQVQDPYSFRCIPQVHGASKDAIQYVFDVMLTEINSVTDNPTIFPDEDVIISAGNFHGQPLALAMDFMAIAVAEIGSISERRIYKLIGGQRGLPAFLVATPGLNSGFMIPQYAAASMVSSNKQLCTPASVDTIDSSNGQEDHVSMGANSATKLYKVVQNVKQILAIELLVAAQAIEFRRPLKSSSILEQLFQHFRKDIAFLNEDRLMHVDMEKALSFLERNDPEEFLTKKKGSIKAD